MSAAAAAERSGSVSKHSHLAQLVLCNCIQLRI
jgi:hypothetical protein